MTLRNIFTPCYCCGAKSVNVDNAPQESGFERVKRMYQKTDFGSVSPEMFYLAKSATTATAVSAFFGAVAEMLKAKDDYFRRNVATQFESEFLAKRRLTDTMTLGAIKGGLRAAVKYGSFSSLYLCLTMTAANYNNKITIWEHIGAGAFLGGIFRLNYGLKGMAAAGTVGGVLGTLTGGILVFALWLSNITLDDMRNYQRENFYDLRRKAFKESLEKGM